MDFQWTTLGFSARTKKLSDSRKICTKIIRKNQRRAQRKRGSHQIQFAFQT